MYTIIENRNSLPAIKKPHFIVLQLKLKNSCNSLSEQSKFAIRYW